MCLSNSKRKRCSVIDMKAVKEFCAKVDKNPLIFVMPPPRIKEITVIRQLLTNAEDYKLNRETEICSSVLDIVKTKIESYQKELIKLKKP